MNGGYLMVSKADTKIYDKLQLGLKVGKPILWYESETVCYYIDTISGGEITSEIVDDEEVITYGNIILTKGGKTITVSYDGTDATVTENGEISNPVMETIKDKNGNLRFVEGEGDIETISGFTPTYNKWSLSGTHLMLVLAGTFANTSVINSSTKLIEFKLPQYILDKIYPVFAITRLQYLTVTMYANDWSNQTFPITIEKTDEGIKFMTQNPTALTLTADRSFRIQFDLLIDADYSD